MSLEAEIEFSLSLLRQSNVEESTVISPLSVAIAFAMVHAGAGGKSKDEIRQIIAKDGSDEQLLEYYKSVGEALLQKSEVQVKLANRIFIRDSYNVKKCYLDSLKKNFNGKAVNLNFSDGKACSKTVNDFVDEATAGMIKKIVAPADFETTVFVLINAIYFNGKWYDKFSPDPIDRDFYAKKGVTKTIPFLHMKSHHDYVETDEVQVLSKSYVDTNFQFVVVLPKEKYGLADVRKNLTAEKLKDLMDRLHSHRLSIFLPKFKIETLTPLVDILKTLGIKEVFTTSGNLSAIAGGGVYISDARQKAVIEVDENETKAAAATCVFGADKKVSRPVTYTPFIADHPFLFFLTHKKTIAFCGHYNG